MNKKESEDFIMTIKELENHIRNLQTELEKLKQAEKEKNKEEKNKLRPWRADFGESYYSIDKKGNVYEFTDFQDIDDYHFYEYGNYYRLRKLAEQDAKELKLRNKIRQYRDVLCENYKYNPCKDNWYIVFCNELVKYGVVSTTAIEEIGQIYFDTQEHAKQVCDILNAELNSYMT